MFLVIRLNTDLKVNDIFEGMTEKIETAILDADSRFLEVEIVGITEKVRRSEVVG